MTQANLQGANTLKTAFQYCNVVPLEPAEMDRFYVDLSAARKTSAIESVSTALDF